MRSTTHEVARACQNPLTELESGLSAVDSTVSAIEALENDPELNAGQSLTGIDSFLAGSGPLISLAGRVRVKFDSGRHR